MGTAVDIGNDRDHSMPYDDLLLLCCGLLSASQLASHANDNLSCTHAVIQGNYSTTSGLNKHQLNTLMLNCFFKVHVNFC